MKNLRAQGMGFDRLADHLNADAVPSRSGKPWHGRVVNRILTADLKRTDGSRAVGERETVSGPVLLS
jgi:hypothetical protein